MWDTVIEISTHVSHDLPCTRCGHSGHRYLPCDHCACDGATTQDDAGLTREPALAR